MIGCPKLETWSFNIEIEIGTLFIDQTIQLLEQHFTSYLGGFLFHCVLICFVLSGMFNSQHYATKCRLAG